MKTVKVLIMGNVQGIFFRKYIDDEAKKIGIKGFVRNLDDGSVEVVIEGENKKVDDMVKVCKIGPTYAKIREVKVQDMPHQGFDSFKVLNL